MPSIDHNHRSTQLNPNNPLYYRSRGFCQHKAKRLALNPQNQIKRPSLPNTK